MGGGVTYGGKMGYETCLMCGEFGVKSSSHVSNASVVSSVEMAKMPIGHVFWPLSAMMFGGSVKSWSGPKPGVVGSMNHGVNQRISR